MGVDIVKQLLIRKACDSDSDPYMALLSYTAIPLQCGLSPANEEEVSHYSAEQSN